ncbi:MAG: hypothetical protein IPK85_22625 [Gemmatimonadetes bacterium]|nr:hypothetical protein [Gemmatimonadota bacterium]
MLTRWNTVVRGDTLWLERPGEEMAPMEFLGGGTFRAPVLNGAGFPTWVEVAFSDGDGRPARLVVGTRPADFELSLGVVFERLP